MIYRLKKILACYFALYFKIAKVGSHMVRFKLYFITTEVGNLDVKFEGYFNCLS